MPTTERPRILAALGSSFAAGPTIEPVEDADAMRSARNYPHLLAVALGATLYDLTVSGATTATILHLPQVSMTGRRFEPQIEGIPADADAVTITAGGNDLQFIGSMMFAAWSRFQPGGPMVRLLAQDAVGPSDVTPEQVESTAQGLVAIVAAARARAPQARIVLVDYVTVVTEQTPAGDGELFTAAELSVLLRTQAALAAAFRTAASRSGAELLAMSGISAGRGLGSPDPWVFGFRSTMATTAGSFHPNGAGMQAIADELVHLLG